MNIDEIAEQLISERRKRYGHMSHMVRSIATTEYAKGIADFLRLLKKAAAADEPKAPVGAIATQQPNHVREPEGGSGAV